VAKSDAAASIERSAGNAKGKTMEKVAGFTDFVEEVPDAVDLDDCPEYQYEIGHVHVSKDCCFAFYDTLDIVLENAMFLLLLLLLLLLLGGTSQVHTWPFGIIG
jgi:hypothetical protein